MKWKPALILIAVLLLGIAGGVLIDRVYLGTRVPRTGQLLRSSEKVLRIFTRELGLNEKQVAAIKPVLKDYRRRFWEVERPRFRKFRKLHREWMRLIIKELTPEQAEIFKNKMGKYFKRVRQRRRRRFGTDPASP